MGHSVRNDVIAKTEERGEAVGELHDGYSSDETGDGLDLRNCRSDDEG